MELARALVNPANNDFSLAVAKPPHAARKILLEARFERRKRKWDELSTLEA